MPASFEVDHGRAVVVVTITGGIHAPEVGGLVSRAREEASAGGYGILYDVMQATLGDISVSDVFWMPRTIPALKGAHARRMRVALTYPAERAQFAQFWETTFANSGLLVRAFTDREAAFQWLAQGREG